MSIILKSGGSSNLANVTTAGAIQVDGSAVTQPVSVAGTVSVDSLNSSTASTPAAQTVTTSSASILAANPSRKECLVVNTGTAVVYLGLGQTPTATAYHIALHPCLSANDGTGGTWLSDVWQGGINAIGAASGTVVVTELS